MPSNKMKRQRFNRSSAKMLFGMIVPIIVLVGLFLAQGYSKDTSGGSHPSIGASFAATGLRVSDGDTIWVNTVQGNKKIRLADIDCPEKLQPWGKQATQFTQRLVVNQSLRIHARAIDPYKRIVADVTQQDGTSLCAKLLESGLAWWYRDYSQNSQLEKLERQARQAKRGLWSQKDPIPPWVFRRKQK